MLCVRMLRKLPIGDNGAIEMELGEGAREREDDWAASNTVRTGTCGQGGGVWSGK